MKNIAFLGLMALSLIACNSEDNNALDQEKPTVNITLPTEHQVFEPGDEIHVQALLTDNESLASYKIEIHSAGDGHTHSHSVLSANDHQEFHYDVSFEISGTSYEVNRSITIPENAEEEHYHLGIFVLDSSGNQNQQFIEIYIGHDHHHHD